MSYFHERITDLIKENIQNPEEAASEIVQMLVAEGLLNAEDEEEEEETFDFEKYKQSKEHFFDIANGRD